MEISAGPASGFSIDLPAGNFDEAAGVATAGQSRPVGQAAFAAARPGSTSFEGAPASIHIASPSTAVPRNREPNPHMQAPGFAVTVAPFGGRPSLRPCADPVSAVVPWAKAIQEDVEQSVGGDRVAVLVRDGEYPDEAGGDLFGGDVRAQVACCDACVENGRDRGQELVSCLCVGEVAGVDQLAASGRPSQVATMLAGNGTALAAVAIDLAASRASARSRRGSASNVRVS